MDGYNSAEKIVIIDGIAVPFFISVIIAALLTVSGCSDSVDDMIQNLDSDNSHVRRSALHGLLTVRHDADTVSKLTALLSGDDERLVLIATQALSTIPDSASVPALGRLVHHANPDIRMSAIQSMGLIGHPAAIPFLSEAAEDSVTNVRLIAVKWLGMFADSTAVPILLISMRDRSSRVRVEAVDALFAHRKTPGAVITAGDFAAAAADPVEEVRYAAVQAVSQHHRDIDTARDILLLALDDRNKHVRTEAIRGLGELSYVEIAPRLKDMYLLATVEERAAIRDVVSVLTNEPFPPPLERPSN
jgi:HEAT repeat protein